MRNNTKKSMVKINRKVWFRSALKSRGKKMGSIIELYNAG